MLLVGACVTVKHIGFRHLLHAPNAGAGIVHDVILGFVAVDIGVGELGNIIVNGFFQAVAEVTADDHAGIGSGNNKAADIGNFAAALGDIAVSVQFIILAIASKGGLPCCLGSQGGQLGIKAQLSHAVRCGDHILRGISQHSAALAEDVQVLAQGFHFVIVIFIGKGLFTLLDGLVALALGNGAELLAIGNNKAQFIVAGHTHILFGHLGVGVELLVLAVRADHAANEGKAASSGPQRPDGCGRTAWQPARRAKAP